MHLVTPHHKHNPSGPVPSHLTFVFFPSPFHTAPYQHTASKITVVVGSHAYAVFGFLYDLFLLLLGELRADVAYSHL